MKKNCIATILLIIFFFTSCERVLVLEFNTTDKQAMTMAAYTAEREDKDQEPQDLTLLNTYKLINNMFYCQWFSYLENCSFQFSARQFYLNNGVAKLVLPCENDAVTSLIPSWFNNQTTGCQVKFKTEEQSPYVNFEPVEANQEEINTIEVIRLVV